MNTSRIQVQDLESGEVNRLAGLSGNTEIRTANSSSESPKSPRRNQRAAYGVLLAAAAVMLAGFAAFRWWNHAQTWVTTDNAYIAGHIHTVSTRIAGNISEVLVSENQEVRLGEVVARLDANDLKVLREKAHAARAQAEAQVAQAHAQVTRDEALASKVRLDFDRADRLFRETARVISQADFDSAKAALDAAHGSLGATRAAVLAAEAQVKAATAQLKDVELQLSYTEITSPATGSVGRKNMEVGNRVQPGQSLLAIVQPKVWITANFKETQLKRLRAGQTVEVSVDSFSGRKFAGRVESIAPASGAQFALLPPDNATGNFTKIVQRVPVKILFDDAGVRDFEGRIVPGMSVTVKVNVRG
jgi:membrane fusion protein (multidrug efflux system)